MKSYQLASKKASKKRRSQFFRLRVYLLFGLICLVIVGFIYLVRESSVFRLHTLRIDGVQEYNRTSFNKSLRELLFKSDIARFLGDQNYLSWLFITSEKLIVLPEISTKKVTVEHNFARRSVTITTEETEKIGVWCVTMELQTECFWFDRKGTLTDPIPEPYGQLILVINDLDPLPSHFEPILSEYALENLITITRAMRDNKISFAELILKRAEQELIIYTTIGGHIIFSLRGESTTIAVSALTEFLKKNNLKDIIYIDLTIPNKILLKTK